MVAQLETPIFTSASRPPYTIAGLVQVFTGTHRNFFTSVMAQALRIAGQGTPVLVVQFLKGGISQGHDHPVKMGEYLDWIRCDLPRCIDTPHLDEIETHSLRQLWQHTQKVVLAGNYQFVVLDELSLAVNFGLIPEAEVLEFLEKRPHHVDIIFTGPEMPEAILAVADQITKLRHHHRS